MILLNFADGVQTVMSGVIQGLGRQMLGLKINVVAFYAIAIPIACLFGFTFKLDIEGLYTGLIFGASAQAVAFVIFSRRVNWPQEAEAAVCRLKSVDHQQTQGPEESTV